MIRNTISFNLWRERGSDGGEGLVKEGVRDEGLIEEENLNKEGWAWCWYLCDEKGCRWG
jgi:hypothetical protein